MSKVVSVKAPNGTYGVGADVYIVVEMSAQVSVDVTAGKPTLRMSNGAIAEYVSGSGSKKLAFRYVVDAKDTNSSDLNAVSLNLNGATIRDASKSNANVTLATSRLSDSADVVVSTTAKTLGRPSFHLGAANRKVTGEATPGATLEIFLNDGTTPYITVKANESGGWAASLTGLEGQHYVRVREKNNDGSVSAESITASFPDWVKIPKWTDDFIGNYHKSGTVSYRNGRKVIGQGSSRTWSFRSQLPTPFQNKGFACRYDSHCDTLHFS